MFDTLARRVEHAAGSPWTFFLAVVVVVVWAATGPIFEWSDTWQLVINTGTTIVTFLMVFLVQATELIRVGSGRNELINIENADVEVLSEVKRDIIVESSVDRDGL
jgi:low affinity Fe/Cu permease